MTGGQELQVGDWCMLIRAEPGAVGKVGELLQVIAPRPSTPLDKVAVRAPDEIGKWCAAPDWLLKLTGYTEPETREREEEVT